MKVMEIIENISAPEVRELALAIFARIIPAYWWTIPASTSGKYHPAFALGEGGLMRHSILVAHTARRNALAWGMSEREQDLMALAGLVHDGLKAGWNRKGLPVEQLHTVHEHPVLMAEALRAEFPGNQDAEFIAHVVESHMGKWTTSKYSEVVLPAPEDKYQWALSAADMMAADKAVTVTEGFFD